MTDYVKGNVVTFDATFDSMPVSASVTVSYVKSNGLLGSTTISMAPDSTGSLSWSAQWDTHAADVIACVVNWHVQSLSPDSAQDGSFNLTANPANT